MLRSTIVRYVIPIAAAVCVVAFVGVPYIDRLLASWFRADVQLRGRLLMTSIEESLPALLDQPDRRSARNYLGRITSDERLLGVVVCDSSGKLLVRTPSVPLSINCTTADGTAAGLAASHALPDYIDVSRFPLGQEGQSRYQVLLAHDLSFISRRQSTARNLVLGAVVIISALLAIVAGLATRLLLNRWVSVLVGDIVRGRLRGDDAQSSSVSQPVLERVREALRDLEAKQRLEIDYRENWTPQALQQVARDQLDSCPIFVVSNREPYIHNQRDDGAVTVQVPASGMVTAVEPIMRACSGTWIAHGSGSADRSVVDHRDHVRVPPDHPSYTLRRVWLSQEEERGYYYGLSNEGLWALCHLAYVRPAFRQEDWQLYERVNARFADAAVQESGNTESVILIQDFHLALLPKLLRTRGTKATIALFWHIPWPNVETFGVCPWKREILVHLLGADILGFHTRHHCQNFLATADRFIECQIDHEHMTVTHQGHVCRVKAYPISIEWPPRGSLRSPDSPRPARDIRERCSVAPGVRVGLGVERWDFTKGILERFRALDVFFDRFPHWKNRLTFLQIAAPSRSQLAAYKALQEETLAECERVNQKHGNPAWTPIVLVGEHTEPTEIFDLYRQADFCLVNSLHDGMNLVAKEYVAAREDEDGVLILSTFAGASRELTEALLVNPFDVVETAVAIRTALEMPRNERAKRMKLMRKTVSENNVYRWAGRLLMDVSRIRQQRALIEDDGPRR